jgi:hypothetical protein
VRPQIVFVSRRAAKTVRDEELFFAQVWVGRGKVAATCGKLPAFQVVGVVVRRPKGPRPTALNAQRVILSVRRIGEDGAGSLRWDWQVRGVGRGDTEQADTRDDEQAGVHWRERL